MRGTTPLFEPGGVVFENHFLCFVGTAPLFEPGVVFENHFDSFFSFFPFELEMGGFAPPSNAAILTASVAVSRTLSGVSVSSPLCARATARMAT